MIKMCKFRHIMSCELNFKPPYWFRVDNFPVFQCHLVVTTDQTQDAFATINCLEALTDELEKPQNLVWLFDKGAHFCANKILNYVSFFNKTQEKLKEFITWGVAEEGGRVVEPR